MKHASKPKPVCDDCRTTHFVGAPCGIPPTETRLELPAEYRLNALDHRISGVHEVLLDLHYNPNFAFSVGTTAVKVVERLEAAYQREYDELAAAIAKEAT
jgi:hypothetical protein